MMLARRILLFVLLFVAQTRANPFWWPSNGCDNDIAVTCDSEMTLFADGNELATSTDVTTATVLTLPYCARLIAIRCTLTSATGGILASFSSGDLTDASWKCTNTEHTDWNKFYYDDSAWPAAVEGDLNSVGGTWATNPDIKVGAKWIWTAGGAADTDVFCRRVITPCLSGSITTNCETDNPCTASNVNSRKLFHANRVQCSYTQCSMWRQCFEMPCSPGLVWKQNKLSCDYGL